jgi:hypothetical protein
MSPAVLPAGSNPLIRKFAMLFFAPDKARGGSRTSEVQIAVVDGGDQLDDEDRARLHAAIEQAQDELDRGEGIPAAQFLADLRSHRG